jgi:hypothetical protein
MLTHADTGHWYVVHSTHMPLQKSSGTKSELQARLLAALKQYPLPATAATTAAIATAIPCNVYSTRRARH